MTKRYDEPIEVTIDTSNGHAPIAFLWRGRRYEIDQQLGSWCEGREWWSREAHDSEFFRVLARPAGATATGDLDADGFMRSPGAVYDIYRKSTGTEAGRPRPERGTEAGRPRPERGTKWLLARVWD